MQIMNAFCNILWLENYCKVTNVKGPMLRSLGICLQLESSLI